MTRIAIIDHSTHELLIEDISDEELEKYNGDEQLYIDDNYEFEGEYEWDYIVDVIHYTEDNKDGVSILND